MLTTAPSVRFIDAPSTERDRSRPSRRLYAESDSQEELCLPAAPAYPRLLRRGCRLPGDGPVVVVELDGAIDKVSARFLERHLTARRTTARGWS